MLVVFLCVCWCWSVGWWSHSVPVAFSNNGSWITSAFWEPDMMSMYYMWWLSSEYILIDGTAKQWSGGYWRNYLAVGWQFPMHLLWHLWNFHCDSNAFTYRLGLAKPIQTFGNSCESYYMQKAQSVKSVIGCGYFVAVKLLACSTCTHAEYTISDVTSQKLKYCLPFTPQILFMIFYNAQNNHLSMVDKCQHQNFVYTTQDLLYWCIGVFDYLYKIYEKSNLFTSS